jgi:hypothetical protein
LLSLFFQTKTCLASYAYENSLWKQQCDFLEEKYKALLHKSSGLEVGPSTSSSVPIVETRATGTEDQEIIDRVMEVSRAQEQANQMARKLEELELQSTTRISELESQVSNLETSLEEYAKDVPLSGLRDRYGRNPDERVVREFLNSPVHTALVYRMVGPLLENTFKKAIHQLVALEMIDDRRKEYFKAAHIRLNRYGKLYSSSEVPDVVYQGFPLAHLVEEFGNPLPIPPSDVNDELDNTFIDPEDEEEEEDNICMTEDVGNEQKIPDSDQAS